MNLLQIHEPGQTPLPHEEAAAVGIDLGTTYSLVAIASRDTVEVVHNIHGHALAPSVVNYAPDGGISRELQAQECPASQGPAALKHPEPNFFVLGAKSYGRNSHFLLRTGFEQVREVFTLITGKADLNLYGK